MTDLPDRARLVIVGAGAVGASVAFHLADHGFEDVLVVDRRSRLEDQATQQAALELVFHAAPSRTARRLAQRSADVLRSLELDGESCFAPVGGIEVATTPERLEELRWRHGLARAHGIEDAELLSPSETAERMPLLDPGAVLGSLFVPSDGIVDLDRAAAELARGAERRGVVFQAGIEVRGFRVEEGRVIGVETDRGEVACEQVVVCAGMSAPRLGRSSGVPVPVASVPTLLVPTEPVLPPAALVEGMARLPILRHPGAGIDVAQAGDRLVLRGEASAPASQGRDEMRTARSDERAGHVEPRAGEAVLAIGRAAAELLPALEGRLDLARATRSAAAVTADRAAIAGEAWALRGFWVGRPAGGADGLGLGRVLAEWIALGEPPMDMSAADVNRFFPFQTTRAFLRDAAAQRHRRRGKGFHPRRPSPGPRGLRLSPFHGRHRALGASFVVESGWERPRWFGANVGLVPADAPWARRDRWQGRFWSPIEGAEHLAARGRVALFDLTPFAKFDVMGADAAALLERLCANVVDRPVGEIVHTVMLTRSGGIRGDVTVTRKEREVFRVVTESGAGPQVLAWMRRGVVDGERVTIVERTSSLFALGLWGPRARDVLAAVTDADLSDEAFPPSSARYVNLGEVFPVWAQRISSVGEVGWELYGQIPMGDRAWGVLWEAGRDDGLIAAGTGALDSLRLESGRRRWGMDLDTEHDPFEAGLASTVRVDKPGSPGRSALGAGGRSGRRLACLVLEDPADVATGGEPVWARGRLVGAVRSAGYGYTVGRGIARAYLPKELAEPGTPLEIEDRGRRLPASVMREPLVVRPEERSTG